MDVNEKEKQIYILSNDNTTFLVFRSLDKNDIIKNININDKKEFLTLVFDFEDLNKELKNSLIFGEIIKKFSKNDDNNHLNIVIKNCLIDENFNSSLYDTDLILNELYISDELYSMSPNINILFGKFKPKKLILKKFKINSKLQLNTFLDFIFNSGCEELVLEDIFIELLIKKDKDDETFNELESYISCENGKIFINKGDKKDEAKIKKLKMIDCPLFALSEDTFKDLEKYKNISLDIDENSLLNANIITKFKIFGGCSDICFDLDSYKLSEEENENKDYIEYLDMIFNIIIDNKDKNNFGKIYFKNFDVTKYEYITGENLTFIDEKNWVLNNKEKIRKKKFEEYDKKINEKIENNLNKLSNVKELLFNNCTNHFINLILKFINGSKMDLNYLKIKKCGKEYFDLKNIMSLNIKNLILFDTPLIIDNFPENNENKFENMTIKIGSLEHYCKENNLDYYKTIEIIVELITKENLNDNLYLEMNALPAIMTFLVAREYNKESMQKVINAIPPYFSFIEGLEDNDDSNIQFTKIKHGIDKRDKLINNSFKLEKLQNKKKIVLKKNNIKNRLENYEFYYFTTVKMEKNKIQKVDFGKDIFNLDLDYRGFFILSGIDNIIFENCLFSNYSNQKLKPELISETIINLIRDTHKNYKFDMKSLNEIIYKNRSAEDITFLLKYLSLEPDQQITSDIIEYLKNVGLFFNNLKYLFDRFSRYINEMTIIFKNIRERKEFYCLLRVLGIIMKEKNNSNIKFIYHEKPMNFNLPNKEEIIKKIEGYFIKKKDENDKEICSPTFNCYYTSEEEKELFGDFENKKESIQFEQFRFKIEYQFSDQWDFIMN